MLKNLLVMSLLAAVACTSEDPPLGERTDELVNTGGSRYCTEASERWVISTTATGKKQRCEVWFCCDLYSTGTPTLWRNCAADRTATACVLL